MQSAAADRFDAYPRANVRHLIGALLLLALLIVLPRFGIGPTTWQQLDAGADETPPVVSAPPAPPTPPPSEPAVAPAESAPAAPVSAPPEAAAADAAPAPVPQPPVAVAAEPVAAQVPPRVTIYFGFDSDNLRADARRRLEPIVAFLKEQADARVQISGYHDTRGNRLYNEDLAERRAFAVREALERAGIARERIIVHRPVKTVGSGKPEQARRTEVSIVR